MRTLAMLAVLITGIAAFLGNVVRVAEFLESHGIEIPLETLALARPASSALDVAIDTDKPRYRIGERVQIRVRVDTDAHLRIYERGPDEAVHLLFPNAWQRDDRIGAGQELVLPPPGAPYAFRVREPAGRSRLLAVASTGPIDDATPLAWGSNTFLTLPARTGLATLASKAIRVEPESGGRTGIAERSYETLAP